MFFTLLFFHTAVPFSIVFSNPPPERNQRFRPCRAGVQLVFCLQPVDLHSEARHVFDCRPKKISLFKDLRTKTGKVFDDLSRDDQSRHRRDKSQTAGSRSARSAFSGIG